MDSTQFDHSTVAAAYTKFPDLLRDKLLQARALIYLVAEELDTVEKIKEELKWGCPSYATEPSGVGTPIRLSGVKSDPSQLAISVHCQTRLIGEFKALYPELNYDGNRSIVLSIKSDLPIETLKHFYQLALNYHLR